MKKVLLLIIVFFVEFIFVPTVYAAGVDFVAGEYVTNNGAHTIKIASDNTVLYDDVYSLTINDKVNGDTITGKIGTDSKSVTFYQLNDSKIVSKASVTYTYNGVTNIINEYEVFSYNKSSIVDSNGKFELWRNNEKINTYIDLQSAVDAANNNDVIKIIDNINMLGGIYVSGKNIIIDGCGYTINTASWLNSLFFVEVDGTLTVKNLIVEGGANGFAVNKSGINILTGTSTKIPLVTGSDTDDVKKTFSVIVTKGKFITENSKYNNNYINGDGTVIMALSGELTIDGSEFNHNRATGKGGVLNLGRKFYSTENDYPLQKVLINDSKFLNNYSTNGGVVSTLNVKNTDIVDTLFKDNTVTGGKGGVILITREGASGYYTMSEKLGLALPNLNIDKTVFEGNWVGNDGSAIENQDAILKITNSEFNKNVGIHSTSSVGTISYSMDGGYIRTMIIDNCVFDNNLGSASIFGDHASSNLTFEVTNTKFINNRAGYNAFLIYTSDVNFKNCIFENEYASRAIVDGVSVYTVEEGYRPNTITFEDVEFINSKYGISDILIRHYNESEPANVTTLVFKDNVKAKADIWTGNKLKINDNYTGVINIGKGTPAENVEISSNATIDGEINYEADKNVITLIVKTLDVVDGYNWEARRYIYSDTKTLTEKEFFLEHQISEDNHKLVYYTDSSYTTPWDYSVSGNIIIYGRWEDHVHDLKDLIVYKNAIYTQCECGLLGKHLSLKKPSDLVENNEKKPIIINNQLGINEEDYTLVYEFLDENGEYVLFDGVPVNAGKYRARITYNNLIIEEEYAIVNEIVNNPQTLDSLNNYIIVFVVGLCSLITLIYLSKRIFFNKNI